MNEVLEIVIFRTKPGVTDDQVLAASDTLQRDVAPLDGYLARRLHKTDDGTWVDTVRWTTLDAAVTAFKAIESKPSAQSFMQIADMESVQMLHAHPVKEY